MKPAAKPIAAEFLIITALSLLCIVFLASASGQNQGHVSPSPKESGDKQRVVSPEGAAYLQKRLKRPPFGAVKFDLKGLRSGMGARREPTVKNIQLTRLKVGRIPCEWVLAPDADPDVRLLYLHGGGWVSGSGGNYLPLAADISQAAKCAVLLPDYRLAPEHPFPAGLEDCIAAHEWLRSNGPAGRGPAKATFIAGDSAGGNLTLATLLALRDRKRPLPAGGIALSAATDFTLASKSLKNVYDPIISARTMPKFRDLYLGKQNPRNPLASPVFGDYRGIPPLLIQVGEHEMLRDDSIRVAKRAAAAGVRVKFAVWPGMVHVFQIRGLPESRAAIQQIAGFIQTNVPTKRQGASQPLAHKVLFLDDHHIAEKTNLKRVMHRPVKKGAVFRPRGKTDGIRVQTASAPIWMAQENVFKLFYMGFPYRQHGWIVGEIGSALAVSRNGLDWTRPVLNRVEIGGSKANNRFFAVDPTLRWGANKFMDVIHDPHDPDPRRRYKGLLGASGRRPVVSPDGIHWKAIGAQTIRSSDTSTLIYDELGKRYLAVVKNGTKFGRSAAVAFSTDFKTWTTPRTTFHTDEEDQRLALDRIQQRLADPKMQNPLFNDPHPKTGWTPPGFGRRIGKSKIPTWRAETYKLAIFPYEGLYIGMPQIYYPTGPALPQRNNTVGFHEIQLAFNRDPQLSRSGWQRLGGRQPFIETSGLDKGLAGNFDRQQIGVLNRPVVRKNELWFYYVGAKGRSLPYKLWPDGRIRNGAKMTPAEKADFDDGWIAICLATLRLDGFVSLKAGKSPGQVVTKQFAATAGQLHLNVDVHDGGEVRVEVLSKDGKPVQGFALSQCRPLRGQGVDQVVKWRDASWTRLAGKTVALRIRLWNADLYSLHVGQDQP